MNLKILVLLLFMAGCGGRTSSYTGTITNIKFNRSITAVTLDTLAARPKSFGAIGHGEVWLVDIDHEHISTLIGKLVVITGSCDGWVCQQVKITEFVEK